MVLSVDRKVTVPVLATYLKGSDVPQTNGAHALPVHLGKTPEESSRDLLYWAILEVARDMKELKAYLMEGSGPATRALPVFQPEMPLEQGREVEFSETGPADPHQIKTMDEVERDAILSALQATDGHRKQAARLLDMAERTLYRKIRQYDL